MELKLSTAEITHLRTLISRRNTDLFDKEQRLLMQISQVSDGTNHNYAQILGTELDSVRQEIAINKAVGDKIFMAQINLETT